MKVLLLAPLGSSHTIKWAESLARRDIKICIVGMGGLNGLLVPDVQSTVIVRSLAANPKTITKRTGNIAKLCYLTKLPLLKRAINSFKPDIVHAHYASSHGLLGSLANFHPLIVSVWGSDVYDFPEISWLHQAVLKFNLSRADRILSTSIVMAKQAERFTSKTVDVTPFGVDVNEFCPQPKRDQHSITIGTIKSLEPQYGIEYLLHAFTIVSERNPLLPLQLLIVGDGSQRRHLETLATALKIRHKVTFAGYVPHHDIARWHNMIDVAVFTSLSESFGVAAVEASSCGKPIVASNTGGLPEVVHDEVTGFIVPPRDPLRTADAIERLIVDHKLRVQMGLAGRYRVKALFNWRDNVTQMVDIYHSVLFHENSARRQLCSNGQPSVRI